MSFLRRKLVRAFVRSLGALDPAACVAAAVPADLRGTVVRVLAIGKVAPGMLRGACERLEVSHALVVCPEGAPTEARSGRAMRGAADTLRGLRRRAPAQLEILRAGHPLPDERSVVAAERSIAFVRDAPEVPLVALVSGGASALVCLPRGVTLAQKRAVTEALLFGGATIAEINAVRRHLSAIKGGGLVRARAEASRGEPLLTSLVMSDVIGGEPWDVGSGLTVADPTTVAQAREVLARRAPAFADLELHETLKPGDDPRCGDARIVASPEQLALMVAQDLRARGFSVTVLPPRTDDVVAFATEYARLARELASGEAMVRAAEPTVTVRPVGARAGRGGRSGHLAALVARALPVDVALLAGASDGVDGTSGAAGACVDGAAFHAFSAGAVDEALDSFDTASLHQVANTRIALGPTGHNLADVHILARG